MDRRPHDSNEPASLTDPPPASQEGVGDPLIGYLVGGKYKILRLLGQGGMSLVYLGKQLNVEREVAIKTLTAPDQEMFKRFEREVKVHGRLKHKNIVHALDCLIEPNGRPFFVMELLRGKSLEDLLQERGGTQNEAIIKNIFGQICEAIGHAHEQGVLHRDLKPGNIVIEDKNGSFLVKVVDFGLAQIQDESSANDGKPEFVAGSPVYMSPEQCMGRRMDVRSDVYSLGVVLYQFITGEVPYDESTVYEMMAAHCDQIRKPDSLAYRYRYLEGAKMLDAIIGAALEAEPDKRIRSINDFKAAIDLWYESIQKGETDDISILFKYIAPDDFATFTEEQPESLIEEIEPENSAQNITDGNAISDELENLLQKTQKTRAKALERQVANSRSINSELKVMKLGIVLLLVLILAAIAYIVISLLN